jgi:hypothetical protein
MACTGSANSKQISRLVPTRPTLPYPTLVRLTTEAGFRLRVAGRDSTMAATENSVGGKGWGVATTSLAHWSSFLYNRS